MRRTNTAECLNLSVDVVRELEKCGATRGTLTAEWSGQTFELSLRLSTEHGRLRLSYAWAHRPGSEQTTFCERVAMTIGGDQLYWRCRCGQRVKDLYVPRALLWTRQDPVFACRRCYHLSYPKQHESKPQRDYRRYREGLDIERRFPASPKQKAKAERLQAPFLSSFDSSIEWLEGRLQHLDDRHLRPRRRPGRPSKREERARQRALQAAKPKRPPGRPKVKRSYTRTKPFQVRERTSEMQGFCMKCRDQREMIDPVEVTYTNGRPALQGDCAVCGTTVTRIVKKEPIAAQDRDEGITDAGRGQDADARLFVSDDDVLATILKTIDTVLPVSEPPLEDSRTPGRSSKKR